MILSIDDDEDAHVFLRRAFRISAIGIPLNGFKDSELALQYLAGKRQYSDRKAFPLPNLLLLDLKMPGKNGFEVLQFMRDRPELGDIPVVVFSSSIEKKDVSRAYALGCHAYVCKSVVTSELTALVTALAQQFFPTTVLGSNFSKSTKLFSSFVVSESEGWERIFCS